MVGSLEVVGSSEVVGSLEVVGSSEVVGSLEVVGSSEVVGSLEVVGSSLAPIWKHSSELANTVIVFRNLTAMEIHTNLARTCWHRVKKTYDIIWELPLSIQVPINSFCCTGCICVCVYICV